MPKSTRKRAGAKTSIVLLSIFLFLIIFSPAVFAETGKLGDINDDGEVDVRDVVLVMRHVLVLEELDEDQQRRADVDGDGEIDVRDATLIMQYALGIIDEFPYDLPEVVSVRAIDRSTIEVELSEDVAEEAAEDPDYYQVTVGNESVEVEDVDYDADDRIAELEVDLEGKSGVLVVNGVEAEEKVPPIPDFTEISALEAALEVVMYFNTPIYADDDLDPGDDIILKVAGDDVGDNFEVEIPDEKDDAEDEVILKITDTDYRPEANDSVRVELDIDGAEKIFNVWDEPMEQPRVYITTATPDDENPRFEEILAFEESNFVVAYFSKPVNTSGDDINVGPAREEVRVTGEDADGTPLEYDGDKIHALSRDEEQEGLRIELDDAIPEGSEITVSFGTDAGRKIKDRAGNTLAGTYTRSATAVEGPTLEDAEVTNLSFDIDDQTQEFSVKLVGAMDEGQELTIDLTEAAGEGIDYHPFNTRYEVDGADGDVSFDDDVITFEAEENIDDGTVLTITAEEIDTTGIGDVVEDIEVVFERSEVGATIVAEFDVVAGLGDLAIDAMYELKSPADDVYEEVDLLASGQDDHTVEFTFTLKGTLEEDEYVEIDVSELVDAGVTFDEEAIEWDNNDLDVELDNDTFTITAEDDDIDTGTEITVTAKEVSVDSNSAQDDIEVVFSRSDSGLSFTEEIDIAASFSEVRVSDIRQRDNESVLVEFTLDGDLETWPRTVRIYLDWEEDSGLIFEAQDDDDTEATYGVARLNEDGVIRYRADEDLEHGTTVEIRIYDAIDATGAEDALTMFRREDSGYKAADILEVE